MDGRKLTQLVLDALDEDVVADRYADQRKIYEYLDQAAAIFAREAMLLHATATITTVAGVQAYDLPPDYIRPYMQNRRGRFIAKLYDGSDYNFLTLDAYERVFKRNYIDNQDYPTRFCIIDKEEKETVIEGVTDAAGAASAGECTLYDASMSFIGTNRVYPRDIIHNLTDGSEGYVLSVTDATHLQVALFEGTNNEFASGDSYVIQPAAEMQLFLEAPAGTSGFTLTFPYVCVPSPVFSDRGFWRLPPRTCRAIAAGAASLFKIPKREFSESGNLAGLFASELSRISKERAQSILQQGQYPW